MLFDEMVPRLPGWSCGACPQNSHSRSGVTKDTLEKTNTRVYALRIDCMKNEQPFIADIRTLRARARKSIENGAVTPAYAGDVKQTIEILQAVLATETPFSIGYGAHFGLGQFRSPE